MNNISTFYVKNNKILDKKIRITGEDVNHIKGALRHKVGDELTICSESGERYSAKIAEITNDEIILNITEHIDFSTEPDVNITLVQGLPKSDKMDFIVQKATELGVSNVIPVITDRVIVKIDESNEKKKVDRWNKIVFEASKQSGRTRVPTVENIVNLENIIEKLSKYDIVIVPYECEKENTIKAILTNIHTNVKDVAVVIGPEGGFSVSDIDALKRLDNIKLVSLGKRILRTETAGIATIAMLLYEYDL